MGRFNPSSSNQSTCNVVLSCSAAVLAFALVLSILGCASGPLRSFASAGPTFSDHYQAATLSESLQAPLPLGESEKLLSISADGMLLREFVRYVAREGGVSVVVEEGLDERTITLDVKGQSVNDILAGVARRLGVQVTRTGSLYFVGELRPEDKGVLVRRVGRLKREELRQAIETLVSDQGKLVVDVDGLVIVGDRVEVLRRVNELIDQLEKAESRSWVIQLYVMGLTKRAVNDLGLDFAPALDVAVSFSTATDPKVMASLNSALDAVLNYEQTKGDVMTLASPTFVVRDGDPARIFVGDQIPIPRRSTSDQGTVTTEGFDTVDAGLTIEVDVRQVGSDRGLLTLRVDRSRVKSFVETAPLISTEEFSTKAIVRAQGVYLLGELSRGDFEAVDGGSFRIGRRDVDNWDCVQIWARTHAIADPHVSSVSDQREASPAAMSGTENSSAEPSASGPSTMGAKESKVEPYTGVYAEPGPIVIGPANGASPSPGVSTDDNGWRASRTNRMGRSNDSRTLTKRSHHDAVLERSCGTVKLQDTLMVRVPTALRERLYDRADRLGVSWEQMIRPLLCMLVDGRVRVVGPQGGLRPLAGVKPVTDLRERDNVRLAEKAKSYNQSEDLREVGNYGALSDEKWACFLDEKCGDSSCNSPDESLASSINEKTPV